MQSLDFSSESGNKLLYYKYRTSTCLIDSMEICVQQDVINCKIMFIFSLPRRPMRVLTDTLVYESTALPHSYCTFIQLLGSSVSGFLIVPFLKRFFITNKCYIRLCGMLNSLPFPLWFNFICMYLLK